MIRAPRLSLVLPLLVVLLGTLFAAPTSARAAAPGQLGKRESQLYQDVLTTRDGSVWRGRLIERGEVYRMRLDDGSEVVVPQAQVATISRELHPGFPHRSQVEATANIGFEVAYMLGGNLNGGLKRGPMAQLGLALPIKATLSPEVAVTLTPISEREGVYATELVVGTRYYIQSTRRSKPYAFTQFVVAGTEGDLGLRTGTGLLYDLSPYFGIGVSQGVTVLVQTKTGLVGPGFSMSGVAQGRF
jgi:hypothetical protein